MVDPGEACGHSSNGLDGTQDTHMADTCDAEETDEGRARAIDTGPLAGAHSKQKTRVGKGPPASHTAE